MKKSVQITLGTASILLISSIILFSQGFFENRKPSNNPTPSARQALASFEEQQKSGGTSGSGVDEKNLDTLILGIAADDRQRKLFGDDGVITPYFQEKMDTLSGKIDEYVFHDPENIIPMFDQGFTLSRNYPLVNLINGESTLKISPEEWSLEAYIYDSIREGKQISADDMRLKNLEIKSEWDLSIIMRWLFRISYTDMLVNIYSVVKDMPVKNPYFAFDRLVLESFYDNKNGIHLTKDEMNKKFFAAWGQFVLYENNPVTGFDESRRNIFFKLDPKAEAFTQKIDQWAKKIEAFDPVKIDEYLSEGDALIAEYKTFPENFYYPVRHVLYVNALLSILKDHPDTGKAQEYITASQTITPLRYSQTRPGNVRAERQPEHSGYVDFIQGILYLYEGKNADARRVFFQARIAQPFSNFVHIYHRYSAALVDDKKDRNFNIWTPIP